jgi:hypothetical protein
VDVPLIATLVGVQATETEVTVAGVVIATAAEEVLVVS